MFRQPTQAVAAVALGLIAACTPAIRAADDAELAAQVRARAAECQAALGSVLLTENAVQTKADGANFAKRQTVADVALVPVSGRLLAFRDVLAVNGTPVHPADGRLARALLAGSGKEADALHLQSARHHFMSPGRNFSTPTLALTLLAGPEDRLKISRVKEDTVDGQKVMLIEFAEQGAPTLARGWEGRDAPARGAAWFAPTTGAFLQTRLTWSHQQTETSGDLVRTEIAVFVKYAPDERLGVCVPIEMRESYIRDTDRVESVDTYSDAKRITR